MDEVERFPWFSHRTMAEVMETERLRARAHVGGPVGLTQAQWARLKELTARERRG